MRLFVLTGYLTLCCLVGCHASTTRPVSPPPPSPSPTGPQVRVLDGNDAPDRHVIDPVIQEHARDIKFCGAAGGRDPRHVAIMWLVGEDGTVTSTKIVSIGRQTDIGVAQCLVTRIKTWKFPAVPGGSYWANYPFSFED